MQRSKLLCQVLRTEDSKFYFFAYAIIFLLCFIWLMCCFCFFGISQCIDKTHTHKQKKSAELRQAEGHDADVEIQTDQTGEANAENGGSGASNNDEIVLQVSQASKKADQKKKHLRIGLGVWIADTLKRQARARLRGVAMVDWVSILFLFFIMFLFFILFLFFMLFFFLFLFVFVTYVTIV